MRSKSTAADTNPPENLDYEMWTGPAPMRHYNPIVHPRSWRAFMEYGNGIVGDMCVHMLDMVRWMLDLGWPKSIASTGGILIDKTSKANITDTQEATFDYGDLKIIWQHRSWGSAPDPIRHPWGATIYGEKGTLTANVYGYDFTPQSRSEKPVHVDVKYELEEYPEDKTDKDLEKQCAPAIRGHMKNFLASIASRGKPVSDIEEGHISTASCILANNALKLGRTLAYDPTTGKVTGDDEATRLLTRPYREPWIHPAAGRA
jgi:predicted dehydrogenase